MSIWIQTYTGSKVNPLDPDPKTINIRDIAHALSNICRFTGHSSKFYSVAEHSYYVSTLVPQEYALHGLLHDASEAYLCDIAHPIKPYIRDYAEIENNLLDVIFKKFGLSAGIPKVVEEVDLRMCYTEGLQIMPDTTCWELQEKPYDKVFIRGLRPITAESIYLLRFERLSRC